MALAGKRHWRKDPVPAVVPAEVPAVAALVAVVPEAVECHEAVVVRVVEEDRALVRVAEEDRAVVVQVVVQEAAFELGVVQVRVQAPAHAWDPAVRVGDPAGDLAGVPGGVLRGGFPPIGATTPIPIMLHRLL